MAFPAGIPALLPGQEAVFSNVVLVVSDALVLLKELFQSPQWGLFDQQSGRQVITPDSVISFDNDQEARVSNFPVEQGGFESYNKVQVPYDVGFVFTKGGSLSQRAAFLAEVDAAFASLSLLTAVTPEKTYPNLNVIRTPLSRSARQGVSLLRVAIYCQQIRLAPPLSFSNTQNFAGVGQNSSQPPTLSNTQNPDGSSPVNGGTVQGVSPSSQTNTSATDGVPGTVQTPTASLTNATGNTAPPGTTAVGSTITYDAGDGTGPHTGVISSVGKSGYGLTDGSAVGKSLVTGITPPGFTAVQ